MALRLDINAHVWPKLKLRHVLLLLLFTLNAYPIYQIFAYHGLVFFSNGLDEGSYLQYHYALRELNLAVRPGQYLVVLMHELGFSGGWINLCMDLAGLSLWLILTREIFYKLGIAKNQASFCALLLTIAPLLFGCFNPLIHWLSEQNTKTHLLYWVTMPQADSIPILRSPEPQSSLVFMSLALYLALRFRNFTPLYLVAPLLYSFMLVPWVFVVLALHLSTLPIFKRFSGYIPALLAYALIGIGLALYFGKIVSGDIRNYIVATHLPLIPFCGCISLPLYFLIRHKVAPQLKQALFLLAISPFVYANHQLISAWIAQPNNFEQYFGVLVCAILSIFAVQIYWRNLNALLVLCILLTFVYGLAIFRNNYLLFSQINLSPKRLQILRDNSENIAINDLYISYLLNLVYPRQKPTLFSFTKVQHGLGRETLREYLCAKQQIRKDPFLAEQFAGIFERLDFAYRNETADDPNITMFRKNYSVSRLDSDTALTGCNSKSLQIVSLLKFNPGQRTGY